MILKDLLFEKKCWIFLFMNIVMNKVAAISSGKIALKDKKIFLMSILFFNDKIFSKFVSMQNQIDINKHICIWLLKMVLINLCIIF